MTKLPWMKFWPDKWLADPCLSRCTPQTRGIWMDLISNIHILDCGGELRGTTDELSRLARCRPEQIVDALTELRLTKTADVTERNGHVTVVSRRIKREAKDRTNNRLRQDRFRRNANVTQASRFSNAGEDRRQKTDKPPISPLRDKKTETFHDYSLKEPARWSQKDWQMYEDVYGKEEAQRLRSRLENEAPPKTK